MAVAAADQPAGSPSGAKPGLTPRSPASINSHYAQADSCRSCSAVDGSAMKRLLDLERPTSGLSAAADLASGRSAL
jgi:hypothetical protein